jgi:hypothetical protein
MRCKVFVADSDREFAFATIRTPGGDDADENGMARWGYTFTSVEGGTDVEESWQLTPSALQTSMPCPRSNGTRSSRR